MRTCSQAHLPITHSSMSSEPVPIAHISEVDNIEEDLPSQETPEVEEEIKQKVQAKPSVVPVDDLISTLKLRSLQSPTLSGQSLVDYQRTTSELPVENYMNFHIIFRWLFGGCLVAAVFHSPPHCPPDSGGLRWSFGGQ